MLQSNLQIKSNLMIDDGRKQSVYFPGDFAYELRPSSFDTRTQRQYWSEKQINEYHQTLKCRICQRSCAGTCEFQ